MKYIYWRTNPIEGISPKVPKTKKRASIIMHDILVNVVEKGLNKENSRIIYKPIIPITIKKK